MIITLPAFTGARIRGAGKSRIAVEGVRRLYPAEFFLGGDRICAGTYLAAAAMTAGDVTVMGAEPEDLREPGTYQDPCRMAEGLDTVLVAGQPVIDGGQYTGVMAGQIVRRS